VLKSKEASLTFDFNKLSRPIVFVCIEIIIFPVSAIVPFFLEHPRSRDDRTDGIIPMSPDLISPSLDFFAQSHSPAEQFTTISTFKTHNSQLTTSYFFFPPNKLAKNPGFSSPFLLFAAACSSFFFTSKAVGSSGFDTKALFISIFAIVA